MPTPIRPEMRNRTDKADSGGASATIIRAEVKAEDHIRAKASPMKIARMSMLVSFGADCRSCAGPPVRTQEAPGAKAHLLRSPKIARFRGSLPISLRIPRQGTEMADRMASAEKFWNKVAEAYAARSIGNPEAYEKTLERARAHLAPGDQALELGCGTGSTALRLADSVAYITATDISSAMIDIARRKAADAAVRNISFEISDLAGAPARDGGYDVVLAFNLLHLLPDLPGALRDLHARLKPGGLFISKTVCVAEMSWFVPSVIRVLRLLGRAPDIRTLSAPSVDAAIAGAGFRIEETGMYPATRHFVVARKI